MDSYFTLATIVFVQNIEAILFANYLNGLLIFANYVINENSKK